MDRENATHVMYIAMLRDCSKRVMKLSKWFGKGFEIGVMEERENGLRQKRIEVEMCFSSIKIESLSSCETFGALLSLFLFFNTYFSFSLFFYSSLFIWGWTQGLLKISKEKTNLQSFFGWDECGYTMNMKWGSFRYISGGRIFRDGVLHTYIFGWG
jgi:hypothetical protein